MTAVEAEAMLRLGAEPTATVDRVQGSSHVFSIWLADEIVGRLFENGTMATVSNWGAASRWRLNAFRHNTLIYREFLLRGPDGTGGTTTYNPAIIETRFPVESGRFSFTPPEVLQQALLQLAGLALADKVDAR